MLVDASVAIKLFVNEPDSISAVATVAGQTLIAPDLIFAEDDVLITADRRFYALCAASPHAARVRLLG